MKKVILIFAVFFTSFSNSFAWWEIRSNTVYSQDGYETYEYNDWNINAYCDLLSITGSYTPQAPYDGYVDLVVYDNWSPILTYGYPFIDSSHSFSGSWLDSSWGTVRMYMTVFRGYLTYKVEWGTFG